MKTKFFKKLSFVLAFAMVLSVFAPAAGAFAAAKPKLNSTNKYLHLGVDKLDEYNFNISGKGKGWKYYWESANEDVAVVNEKNGVTTATGVGKTKVTVTITDKDKEVVAKLSATVTVRDNIKTVKISNPVEKLAVGEEHDYNRSYTTVSGSTKKTSAITRWTVNSDKATINDSGVFVATEAGEYEVTARSFQSKAKYEDWQKDAEKYADYVLATDTTKVVVSAGLVDIRQINQNKFAVEFDTDMSKSELSATSAMVYQIINGKPYNTGTEKIKSLSFDATGKVATVELYGNFVPKSVYQFTFGELKAEFTAADTDEKEIAGIVFDDFQVKTDLSEPVNLLGKVNAVNKQGVVIRSGNDISGYLTFEYQGDDNFGWVASNSAYITKNGYSAKFVAKYNNFVYDDATKTYKTVEFVDEAIGTGVDIIISNSTMQYAVVTDSTAPAAWKTDWATGGFKVPAGDGNYNIFTRYKRNTDPSWANYVYAGNTEFTYVSTDTDKMVIIDNHIYASTQGVVTVLVQDPANNNAVIGAFDVTIVGSRGYASAEADKYQVSLGNFSFSNTADNEKDTITVENKDTMGSALAVVAQAPEFVNEPANAIRPLVTTRQGTGSNLGKTYIDVEAAGATVGTYRVRIKLDALNTTKVIDIYVNVLDSSVVSALNWKVELDSANVDLKEQSAERDVTVNVYGYNSRNARVAVLNTSEFELEVVKSGTSTNIKSNGIIAGNVIPVAYDTSRVTTGATTHSVTGTAMTLVDVATYRVAAKALGTNNPTGRSAGVVIGQVALNVTDSSKLEFKRENASVSATSYPNVHQAVKKAFALKLNDSDINWDHVRIEYTLGGNLRTDNGVGQTVNNGDSIHVSKIFFEKTFGSNGKVITYTYEIKQAVTISR